jgi:hypothetical protein
MASLLEYVPAIGDIIDRVLPDPKQKEQLKYELAKLQANENVSRMGVLQSMFQHKSLFVSGGIPSLIWLGVIALFNNYVLIPWAGVFGFPVPDVALPEQYWTLLGWVITGLFGKKIVDDNAWFWNGKLVSPSKKSLEASIYSGTTPAEKVLEQESAEDYVERRLAELKAEMQGKEE